MIKINWEKNPLIPVVVQSAETKEVLMLGYMNEEAFKLTRATGYAHYYSRSRKRLWKKGESSNNTQKIVDTLLDCDGDTLLLLVEQKGVACHTGRKSCFFTSITKERVVVDKTIDVENIYGVVDRLYHTILERKEFGSDSNSWTKKLLSDRELLLKKIREEAEEFCRAVEREDERQVIYEASDLLYHSLVGLALRDLSPDRVRQELDRRFGVSGIEEKRNREPK
jgi:phosphoribosyl-ATP pyrophosphohydrolase/phosphoribosyl-AMP cyclohydrolase